jgi:cytochrome c biogenesis protein CcdA/HEAT repeat protein
MNGMDADGELKKSDPKTRKGVSSNGSFSIFKSILFICVHPVHLTRDWFWNARLSRCARLWLRKSAVPIVATILLSIPLYAQDELKALKAEPTKETLAAALPLLADPAARGNVRSTVLGINPFPAADLVALLSDPRLAVRLGALETLEEKAGGDYDFNPWSPTAAPENEAPLARWQKWLGESGDDADRPSSLLNEDQRHGYLRDLLADDRDRSARARRMLEADGLSAVGFLEDFLANSATLPAGSRAKVREAQYQIVLSPAFGPQAPATARQLAFGSRDQILTALGNLKSAGLSALPIIRDFIAHPDALVRETAMDAMLASGGSQSLEVIGPALAKETDPNVIHGALRRLKEIPGDISLEIATSFLSRDEEDLLISAIQACQKLVAGSSDPFSGGGSMTFGSSGGGRTNNEGKDKVAEKTHAAVIAALTDPRWRVRTAALEFVTAAKVSQAADTCVKMLRDEDDFVRFSAIKAAIALGAKGALPVLKEMFMENPETAGPVLEGYAALGSIPDDAMMERLATYPPDARVAAIRAATTAPSLAFIPIRFANDPDLDVACAALRYLSSDDDRMDSGKVATVLVEALRSGIPEKRAAVLDQISLPKGEAVLDPELAAGLGAFAKPPEKTPLDPLYDLLLDAAAKSSGAADSGVKEIPGAKGALFGEIAKIAASDDPNSFRAALALAITGDPAGLRVLLENLPKYSTAQRAAIAGKLYQPSRKEALQLLAALVRDPVDEVRSDAVESALSAENTAAFLSMALEALTEPDSPLAAHQFYSYRFSYASRNRGTTATVLTNWAAATYADETAKDPIRILAFIALAESFPSSAVEKTVAIAKSAPNKWLRRAAWHALGTTTSPSFRENLEHLVADPSPFVRAVLAESVGAMDSAWQHRFDDVHSQRNNSWSSNRSSRRIHSSEADALAQLAATDPSPEVRFESMFALLSHGREIDVEAFAILLRSRPAEDRASHRVASWMNENQRRLGPGLAPIVSALNPSEVNPRNMSVILSKMSAGKEKEAGFASFAALAARAEGKTDAPQLTAAPDEEEENEVERETLKVIYFFKPGCAECDKASRLLETMKADFPLLETERHNINETRGTLLNQALCARFNVPSPDHNIAPAFFTQAGFLVRDDITPQAVGKLLASTMDMPQDDAWAEVAEPEIAAAQEKVEERYRSLTLPVVLLAGLIDGVNPCAFATIIFFLSYLQIARRSPREMLMVGAAFISAVFLAYFFAGLALHSILEQMTDKISGIKPYLDWAFAGLALVAALISFRDAAKARAGKLDEMALTLPAFLKDRIRGVVRTGARARRFVIAAFVAGILISFLELACTGQVYAPIIYSIQQGKLDAVAWLLAYNLAFITPLIIIFALAFTGMSNKALIDFQTRHTFSVKIALGLVFLALAAVILFGARML